MAHTTIYGVLRHAKHAKMTSKSHEKGPKCKLLIAKNAFLARFWLILGNPLLLNGKLLGFKKLISLNYWVWYLENRNQLDEHFASSPNHLDEHFTLFGLYKSEHFRAFTAKYTL